MTTLITRLPNEILEYISRYLLINSCEYFFLNQPLYKFKGTSNDYDEFMKLCNRRDAKRIHNVLIMSNNRCAKQLFTRRKFFKNTLTRLCLNDVSITDTTFKHIQFLKNLSTLEIRGRFEVTTAKQYPRQHLFQVVLPTNIETINIICTPYRIDYDGNYQERDTYNTIQIINKDLPKLRNLTSTSSKPFFCVVRETHLPNLKSLCAVGLTGNYSGMPNVQIIRVKDYAHINQNFYQSLRILEITGKLSFIGNTSQTVDLQHFPNLGELRLVDTTKTSSTSWELTSSYPTRLRRLVVQSSFINVNLNSMIRPDLIEMIDCTNCYPLKVDGNVYPSLKSLQYVGKSVECSGCQFPALKFLRLDYYHHIHLKRCVIHHLVELYLMSRNGKDVNMDQTSIESIENLTLENVVLTDFKGTRITRNCRMYKTKVPKTFFKTIQCEGELSLESCHFDDFPPKDDPEWVYNLTNIYIAQCKGVDLCKTKYKFQPNTTITTDIKPTNIPTQFKIFQKLINSFWVYKQLDCAVQ
jgi:hypothetical protein